MRIQLAKERTGQALRSRGQLSRISREAARLSGLEARVQGMGLADAVLNVNIVGSATIRALNRAHLGHDWVTDVIAFDLPPGPQVEGETVPFAEIYVCLDLALESARELHVDPARELALYIVHGCLHLAGMDDQTVGDREAMRRAEAETLAALEGTVTIEGVL